MSSISQTTNVGSRGFSTGDSVGLDFVSLRSRVHFVLQGVLHRHSKQPQGRSSQRAFVRDNT